MSQIQDEISKATQSSMGKVSVQGENPSVSAEQGNSNAGASQDLELGNLGGLTQSLGGLNSQSIGGLGGGLNSIGGLDGSSNGKLEAIIDILTLLPLTFAFPLSLQCIQAQLSIDKRHSQQKSRHFYSQ